MSELKYTILESWPALKEDFMSFLSDTDAWIIAQRKTAYEAKDWQRILNVVEIMESVHTLSHSH